MYNALGKLKVDVLTMPVDYLTIVGHKFYGPRVGALYCRGLGGKLRGEPSNQTAPLSPLVCGGRQERGLRPGTQNTGMIAGLGKACELVADNVEEYSSHMRTLRDYLELKLKETFGDGVCINGCHGNLSERLPNTSNFSLTHPALSGHRILGALECSQISGGAACHSYTNARPSPFLLASGVEREVAVNALRVSVGRETTTADIDHFIADLRQASDRIIADHVTNSHN